MGPFITWRAAGPYPDHVVPGVHILTLVRETWTTGTPMPAARARGGGGTALYNGKLYLAGGLQDTTSGTGHDGVSVNLFDVYDPQAGTWTALPNMPRPRDHFHAAVVGDKFYAIAGRQGAIPDFFNAVIPEVDVYDLTGGTWSTLPSASNLPTPRAAAGVAVLDHEIIVIGGEGNGQAWNTVEAFDTTTGTWRTLLSMPTARHGIQAAVCNGGIYVVGGALTQGGETFTNVQEVLFLGIRRPADLDSLLHRARPIGSTPADRPSMARHHGARTCNGTVTVRQRKRLGEQRLHHARSGEREPSVDSPGDPRSGFSDRAVGSGGWRGAAVDVPGHTRHLSGAALLCRNLVHQPRRPQLRRVRRREPRAQRLRHRCRRRCFGRRREILRRQRGYCVERRVPASGREPEGQRD